MYVTQLSNNLHLEKPHNVSNRLTSDVPGSKCVIFMDPHIETFDDDLLTLTTKCNYSLVQPGFSYSPDFAVYTQFE